MFFKKSSFLLLCLFLTTATFSQSQKIVEGVVKCSDTPSPIAGVTIFIRSSNISTVSNEDGMFRLVTDGPIKKPDTLWFTCIGYRAQFFLLDPAKSLTNLVISLERSNEILKEVVVRPLSIFELVDSLKKHNQKAFLFPSQYSGYYKEQVYTNSKCTEFSDALFDYKLAGNKFEGELKIIASRCLKQIKDNEDKNNVEIYNESKINPNEVFRYALFTGLMEKFFPYKSLVQYDYKIEDGDSGETKITIFPKKAGNNAYYHLIIYVKENYDLKAYRLEVPMENLHLLPNRSLLGIHVQNTSLILEASFKVAAAGIFPNYFSMTKETHIWGKFMGATFNQQVINSSQFIVSDVHSPNQMIDKSNWAVYKKGNLCSNGMAINDNMLKNYTIIKQTSKDSLSISTLKLQ